MVCVSASVYFLPRPYYHRVNSRKQAVATDNKGNEVTEDTWKQVDMAIAAFIKAYPRQWSLFREDLRANETEYQLALEGDLKKSGFRNTLSFPVAMRPRTPEETGDSPGNVPVEFMDSLWDWIQNIIPGFTSPDEPGRPNRLYKQFIKKYGQLFQPGLKY